MNVREHHTVDELRRRRPKQLQHAADAHEYLSDPPVGER